MAALGFAFPAEITVVGGSGVESMPTADAGLTVAIACDADDDDEMPVEKTVEEIAAIMQVREEREASQAGASIEDTNARLENMSFNFSFGVATANDDVDIKDVEESAAEHMDKENLSSQSVCASLRHGSRLEAFSWTNAMTNAAAATTLQKIW